MLYTELCNDRNYSALNCDCELRKDKRQRERKKRKRTRECERENEKKGERKMDDKEAHTRLKLFVKKNAKSKKYFKL